MSRFTRWGGGCSKREDPSGRKGRYGRFRFAVKRGEWIAKKKGGRKTSNERCSYFARVSAFMVHRGKPIRPGTVGGFLKARKEKVKETQYSGELEQGDNGKGFQEGGEIKRERRRKSKNVSHLRGEENFNSTRRKKGTLKS